MVVAVMGAGSGDQGPPAEGLEVPHLASPSDQHHGPGKLARGHGLTADGADLGELGGGRMRSEPTRASAGQGPGGTRNRTLRSYHRAVRNSACRVTPRRPRATPGAPREHNGHDGEHVGYDGARGHRPDGVRDGSHRLRGPGGGPCATGRRAEGPLPRPAGIGARPPGARGHRARGGRRPRAADPRRGHRRMRRRRPPGGHHPRAPEPRASPSSTSTSMGR